MERFLRSHEIAIRGIWAADCSQQGASGVLNEYTQGDDSINIMVEAYNDIGD